MPAHSSAPVLSRSAKVLTAIMLAALVLLAIAPARAGDDDHSPKRLIAYYPDWAKW